MAMLPGTRSPAAPSSASRSIALGRVDGELGRQPAAQRAADDVHALEAEAVEDVEVVVDEVVHRLDLGQVVGAAEARMVGRHHREAAGQEPEEGMPRAGAAGRVEEEQRRTLAAALDVDRAAAQLEPLARALGQRAGRVGHAGSVARTIVRCANRATSVDVRFLDVSGGRRIRCAQGLLAHIRALCEHEEERAMRRVVVGVGTGSSSRGRGRLRGQRFVETARRPAARAPRRRLMPTSM